MTARNMLICITGTLRWIKNYSSL